MSKSINFQIIKRSRKKHACEWCGGDIEIGSSYHKWIWIEDGSATTMRAHMECIEAFEKLPGFEREETYFNREQPRGCNCGFDPWCERCHPGRGIKANE